MPKKCKGYLVIFDIRDSTARKKESKEWLAHTVQLYRRFDLLAQSIADELGGNLDQTVIKHIGDSVMGFFAVRKPTTRDAQMVIDQVIAFREAIHADPDELLDQMTLKSVATYIDQIHLVDNDVLGRGVDFCFRLETIADCTHIVINKGLAKLLGCVTNPQYGKFAVIPSQKSLKGWANAQDLFILTSEEMLRDSVTNIKASSTGNVTVELLKFLVDQLGDAKAKERTKKRTWAKK